MVWWEYHKVHLWPGHTHAIMEQAGAWGAWGLTTVAAHVDLQGAGAGAAFAALGEGADTLVGVWLLGLFISGGCGWRTGVLAAGTVVQEVGLQVPFTAVPNAAVLAGEDVFCGSDRWVKPEGIPWQQRESACNLGRGSGLQSG